MILGITEFPPKITFSLPIRIGGKSNEGILLMNSLFGFHPSGGEGGGEISHCLFAGSSSKFSFIWSSGLCELERLN
jgi:hypothetical protein